jgi:hypothetical protein
MGDAFVLLVSSFLIRLRQANIAQIFQRLSHAVDEVIVLALRDTEPCVIKSSDQSRSGT